MHFFEQPALQPSRLVACANVANLLLVRVERRRQELAVMSALGAGHRRIALALFLESVILGVIGSVIGLGLAFAALEFCSTPSIRVQPIGWLGSFLASVHFL